VPNRLSRLAAVRRAALIAALAALLAGCGGEDTVSPTGEVEGTLPKAEAGDPAAGKSAFTELGCGGCHTFMAAGTTGTTGPNLDETLAEKDAAYIERAIANPNAEIAPGFQAGVMPNYGEQLESKQIADLVAFLQQNQA
jgi:mono/diheme cytochrome c family protein